MRASKSYTLPLRKGKGWLCKKYVLSCLNLNKIKVKKSLNSENFGIGGGGGFSVTVITVCVARISIITGMSEISYDIHVCM